MRRTIILHFTLAVFAMTSLASAQEINVPNRVIRHCVFFKYKEGTSDADAKKVREAFDGLPGKVDSIKGYERGLNTSKAGLSDGLTDCFLVSFANEAGREKYLPHPDHKAFGAVLGPHLDKVFVVDFWGHQTDDEAKHGAAKAKRVLRHGVFVKFRKDVLPEKITEIENAFEALPAHCPTIKSFEWGKNNSPETHDEGFTHCYLMTFDDPKGLKEYADSAEHTALVEKLLAAAERARVLDFWSKGKENE